MTKTKSFHYGEYTFKSYFKEAGAGYEVGLKFGNKQIFVGNFVYAEEAKRWWTTFNQEVHFFGKKYWASDETPFAWYCNFMSHYLYNSYYQYLSGVFKHHTKTFNKYVAQDTSKYNKMKHDWDHNDKYFVKAA